MKLFTKHISNLTLKRFIFHFVNRIVLNRVIRNGEEDCLENGKLPDGLDKLIAWSGLASCKICPYYYFKFNKSKKQQIPCGLPFLMGKTLEWVAWIHFHFLAWIWFHYWLYGVNFFFFNMYRTHICNKITKERIVFQGVFFIIVI